jgi:hypothetical protein
LVEDQAVSLILNMPAALSSKMAAEILGGPDSEFLKLTGFYIISVLPSGILLLFSGILI